MSHPASASVETRTSWIVATVALAVLTMSYGAPLVTVVALKPIAAEFGTSRSAPALAISLTYIGAGLGGIAMGWLAERIGIRAVVMGCGSMIGAGLLIASWGGLWQLYACNLLLIGLLGAAGMFAPLMTYVTRWFDRRRGSAVALISSGQYVAGAVWPSVFQAGIDATGWRWTMALYGAVTLVVIVPLAAWFLRPPPQSPAFGTAHSGPPPGRPVLGLPPNVVMGVLAAAVFCCCVTMSMPLAHMVAFCSDIGILPAHGALMLSVLLGSAFLSRQFWGWLADRLGGLPTILFASAGQAAAMAGFLLTQDEVGLFTVSAIFGLGFGGLIPGYVLAIRDLFPASEAGWRLPVVLFPGSLGMAAGGWLAGVMYDAYGTYGPAFAAGVLVNLVNLILIVALLFRGRGLRLATAQG
ncbi:MAG: MFS transporter [Acetobacteraceae bacterium]